jgi:hypothetical protein
LQLDDTFLQLWVRGGRGGYTHPMTDYEREPKPEPKLRMTEQEALQEYIRLLDEIVFFLGREELPYALRTLHQDRLIRTLREAREASRKGA